MRIMGFLPPIQFIKDFTQSRLSQVEALLKIADMGSDFEPSQLAEDWRTETMDHDGEAADDCRAMDQDNKWNSGIECIAGPGGSVEMRNINNSVASVEGKSLETNDSWIKWNTVPSDKEPSCAEQSYAGVSVNSPEEIIQDKQHGHKTVDLRTDIYGLKHSDLWQQVVHTKCRAQDRSYSKEQSEVAVRKPNNFTASQVTGLLEKNKGKMRKNARLFRNIDEVLSSRYHMQKDDD